MNACTHVHTHTQDWNMPGKMWCDGPRQEAVFAACKPRAGSSAGSSSDSSDSAASRPTAGARGAPVVAAAAAATGSSSSGSGGVGGGALHVVPAGSSHASFTDVPFLISPWVNRQLRKLVSVVCSAGAVVSALVCVHVAASKALPPSRPCRQQLTHLTRTPSSH
jgi:hypothetical protein